MEMASGTSTSTQETSSGIIEDVIMDTSSSGPLQPASNKDNKQKESEKKPNVSSGHTTDSSSKDDVSDIVSQTRSGSAPVSVISSAQSMDPSKKDSGMQKYR